MSFVDLIYLGFSTAEIMFPKKHGLMYLSLLQHSREPYGPPPPPDISIACVILNLSISFFSITRQVVTTVTSSIKVTPRSSTNLISSRPPFPECVTLVPGVRVNSPLPNCATLIFSSPCFETPTIFSRTKRLLMFLLSPLSLFPQYLHSNFPHFSLSKHPVRVI